MTDDLEYAADEFPDELSGILGSSVAPVEPPARVRAELLDAIRRTPQERSEDEPDAGAPEPPADRPAAAPSSIDDRAERGRGADVVPLRRRTGRILLRAAAVLAIGAAGAGGYALGKSDAMDSMASEHSYAMLNQMQDVERAMEPMADGHIVTLTWSSEMKMAAVTLPAAMSAGMEGSGRTLQVWVRKDGVVSSAGMYDPAKGADFAFIDVMPEAGVDVFVTEEPAGGSSQPTGSPLVVVHVGGAPSTSGAGAAANTGTGGTGSA